MARALLRGTAFITGAGSGIGQHTAYALATHGISRLALADISTPSLRTTISALQHEHPDIEVLPLQMNVASEEDVKRGIRETMKRFGRLDCAINNAGIGGRLAPSTEVERAEWESVMSVNLMGCWLCLREEVAVMRGQEILDPREGRGVIVNVASMLGLRASTPNTPATAYTASKHGVMGLTKTDALQYAPLHIRINAICPGYVATPLLKASASSEAMAREIDRVPMKRLGEMEEIADAVVFLCSRMSSFMTGTGLVVDGGWTA
ncbi:oxidoreductase [Patellaria atrata CBS 101060]|uniref:Oxidoreductase n=1 Tax=Patellaria atrata CBS 101060 TaxID=1346257 RepID=A0A9P4SET3_9PEZI|nr:oxidoreductase [Patellaria atrata CBS 101060]